MPRIPYDPGGGDQPSQFYHMESYGPGSRPIDIHTDPVMFGSSIGAGLEKIGQGLDKTAESFYNIQNFKDEATVNNAVTDNFTQLAAETEEFKKLPVPEQQKQLPQFLQRVKDLTNQGSANMSPNQKTQYDRQTLYNVRNHINTAVTTTVENGQKYTVSSLQGQTATLMDNTMANISDDATVQKNFAQIKANIAREAEISKVAPEARDFHAKTQMGAVARKIITDLVNGPTHDTARAKDILGKLYNKDHEDQSHILGTEFDYLSKVIRERELGNATDQASHGNFTPVPGSTLPQTKPTTQPQKKSETTGSGLYNLASYTHDDEDAPVAHPGSPGSSFLSARAGSGVDTSGLAPNFASRLETAIRAAEAQTGEKVTINDAYRDSHRQAQYYANYTRRPVTWQGQTYMPHGGGGLAAPPGRSRHQLGQAADLRRGAVLSLLRQWHESGVLRSRFGLEFLPGRAFYTDPVHIKFFRGWGGTRMAGTQ